MTELLTTVDGDALLARYVEVRSLTEALASPLSAEDQTVQSMPDVSPTKWHRAHTTWFFETFLLHEATEGYEPYHPAFGFLFNSYYEGVGARHPRAERGLLSRPGVEDVAAYRAHVDQRMEQLVQSPLDERAESLVTLGLHHEQQHQELLLMDIKHVLSRNPLQPAYAELPTAPSSPAAATTWSEYDGGTYEIGHDGQGFAFDNECPRHLTYLQPFAMADRPVTCGEWLAFIADGGYHRAELWLSDGWATVQAERWDAPLYWSRVDDRWRVFTLGGPKYVDPSEPVCHVSYYEADAFARWAGARLPTEGEWEIAAVGHAGGGHFLDRGTLHPSPWHDTGGPPAPYGDVWQWTSSSYAPYPGFTVAPGAVGEYNGKFMVNQYVLRGGSCATPAGHVRATYRNFFPPAARWAFSGLRLSRDA